ATDAISKGVGSVIGSIFSRATPMPVFVTNQLPVSPGGVAGTNDTGILGKLSALVAGVTIAGITITAAGALANAISPTAATPGSQQNTLDQNRRNPFTHIGGPAGTQNTPGVNELKDNTRATKDLTGELKGFKQPLRDIRGFTGFEGKGPGFRPEDAFKGTSEKFNEMVAALDQLH